MKRIKTSSTVKISRVLICFTILLSSLFVLEGVTYAQSKYLRYGYIEFPPFTYTDVNKKPSGFLVDWASKILTSAGYRYDAQSFPVLRLAEYLVDGKIDMWIGLKTLPQFEGTTFKGEVKVTDLILRAYTIKGNKTITKKEDLSGLSIIVMRGYSYGGWINYIENPDNKVKYIKANKHTYGLQMLQAGRAEYFLDYKAPLEIALRSVKLEGLKYTTIKALPIYFIISGNRKDGAEVLHNLEAEFLKLKKENKLTY